MKALVVTILCFCVLNVHATAQITDQQHLNKLQKVAQKYQKLLNKEELPHISLIDKPILKLGDTSEVLPNIKQRLKLLGDLKRAKSQPSLMKSWKMPLRNSSTDMGLTTTGSLARHS